MKNFIENVEKNEIKPLRNEDDEKISTTFIGTAVQRRNRVINCSICGRAFKGLGKRAHLKRHLERKHANIRPFQCDLCEFTVSNKPHLKRHLKAHMKDPRYKYVPRGVTDSSRPFKCTHPGCEMYFKRSEHMTKHLNVHNSEFDA
jgi:uncharacterized Zn-finger protein